jgi:murein DD-endopeptidase MepM/ murein hydrolase activator NlpD
MSKMHFEKTRKKGSKTSKGFYIALGVCLIAIGAAAWTTYDGVKNYMNPAPIQSGSPAADSSQADQEAGNTISGIFAQSSQEEESSQEDTSSQAESSSQDPVSSQPEASSSEAVSSTPTASVAKTQNGDLNIYPVGQKVTKEFSGKDPIYSQTLNDWRVHEGVDLSAEEGEKVKAVSAGTVKDIYEDPMLGTTVVITHKDFEAYYCGLGSSTLVKIGDTVKLGQEIGSIHVVPSESVEENHLHFGIKKNDQWVDPLDFLTGSEN